MQPLCIFNVIPKVPVELESLWQIAHNYLFAWNSAIVDLFTYIDPDLWARSYGNPVWFLNHVEQSRYEELVADESYLRRLQIVLKILHEYQSAPSKYHLEGQEPGQPVVAYFSLEFAVALCLPIYSGGLGVLAGDHLKSASDLNLPLVGIGLAYRNGYFRQYMTPDGWQQERYPDYDFEQMPMRLALTPEGERAVVRLQIGERVLAAQIWECRVGRIPLYLMDSNISENPVDFRAVTARLYGGDAEMRLWQEMLLGMGGVRALEALGLRPQVIHMNEGHSAFAGLERIRSFMRNCNLSYEAAVELTSAGSVFTTHTPVPAGNDRFSPDLMYKYFSSYAQDMGLAFKVFMALGREDPYNDGEPFCMTVLALRLSRFNNGVSLLHGKVSRHMWNRIWPQYPEDDLPIGSITNGVHVPTWIGMEMGLLFDRFLGPTWREENSNPKIWKRVETIPDNEIWRAHERQRAALIDFVRLRFKNQLLAQGVRSSELQASEGILNPDALTIGFARRFATYKRANMLLMNKEELLKIVGNSDRPVQFVFAGKAHPKDNEGKQLMKEIIRTFRQPEFRDKMVFLEDYDMEVAQYMISGCDIWLNNPRRPLEACGTSGMKAMFNGVLQLSSLDGWWDEAWKPDNSLGWAIGKGEEYDDFEYQDLVELQTLYKVLGVDIIPEFYQRQNGVPRAWTARMKNALIELGPFFNSNRMVLDYMNQAYIPSFSNNLDLQKDNFRVSRELSEWRMGILTRWSNVRIGNVKSTSQKMLFVGDRIRVSADIFPAGIPLENLQVEIYAGKLNQDNNFISRDIVSMRPEGEMRDGWQSYSGEMPAGKTGRYGLSVRALPLHHLLPYRYSGLIHWANVE
ncbi:MAG: alpha-glucan family phosphorylase [Deltaproteobacteria bacterium]|jgi:starch phosphorylase|nr:alpha-glucan family phosphorylase [Deltaproteobacteria bacterium]